MSNPLAKVIRYIVTGGTITAPDVQAAIEQLETITTNINNLLLSHKTRHENNGADEISVAGLLGLLNDPQNPLGHKTSHQDGGSDELSVAGLSGLLADEQNAGKLKGITVDITGLTTNYTLMYDGTKFVFTNVVPGLVVNTHGSTHIEGGLDQITGELISPQKAGKIFTAAINITGLDDKWILKYDTASGTWIAQTFLHAASHEQGQPDAISSLPTASEKLALAGTSGTPSGTNKFVTNDDKVTNIDPVLPSAGEKAALAGTLGTPSVSNKFVTNQDKNTNIDPVLPTANQKSAMDAASLPSSMNPFATLFDLSGISGGGGTVTSNGTALITTKAFVHVQDLAVNKQGTPVTLNTTRNVLETISLGTGTDKPFGLVNKFNSMQVGINAGSCIFNSAGTINVTNNVSVGNINSIVANNGLGKGVVNVSSVGIIAEGDVLSIIGSVACDGQYKVDSIVGSDITVLGVLAANQPAAGGTISSTKFYKDRIISVSGTSLNNDKFTITNVAGNVLTVEPVPVNETSTATFDYFINNGEIILIGLMTLGTNHGFDPAPSVITPYYYDTSVIGYGTTPNTYFIGEQYSKNQFLVDIRKVSSGGGGSSILTPTDYTSGFTLGLANANYFNRMTDTTPQTVTVPADGTTNFPVGTPIVIEQANTGAVTIAAAGGVTIESRLGFGLAGKGSICTLIKTSANNWVLFGDLTSSFGTLTDGATVAVNAGSYLQSLTMTGNTSRTISNPTGAYDGARILFRFIQGSGSDTVAWDTQYEFTTGVPQPTLSTTINTIDYVAFIYYAATSKWHCLATNANGYT